MRADLLPQLAFGLVIILSAINLNKLRWSFGVFKADRWSANLMSVAWWTIGTLSTVVVFYYQSGFTREDEMLSLCALILCLLYNIIQAVEEKLTLINLHLED